MDIGNFSGWYGLHPKFYFYSTLNVIQYNRYRLLLWSIIDLELMLPLLWSTRRAKFQTVSELEAWKKGAIS